MVEGMPSGFRDPEAVLGERAVRSRMEPLFALPLLVVTPAPVFLALSGRLTFDWKHPLFGRWVHRPTQPTEAAGAG